MNKSHQPLNLNFDFIQQTKETFARAGFSESGILARLYGGESVTINPKEMPRLLQKTSEGTPLDTFIRLFFLGVDVEVDDARRAVAPMTLDSWCTEGLLNRGEKSVSATLRIAPAEGFLVVYDPTPSHPKQESTPDHVCGIGPLSMDLLNMTIRRDVQDALDLGTGCGIQGMRLARHSQRVVASDINSRALNIAAYNAALNGINNIEFYEGECFDPVIGERFDLITMNSPCAITPDSRFSFRDGGMEGDGFLQKIVREAPNYLKKNGFLQIMAQWAHTRDLEWQARLAEWFKDTDCHVWVIRLVTQSPETYAANWIMETEKHNAAGYTRRWEEWMAYYQSLGIESISTGVINMHRVGGRPNMYWTHEEADRVDKFAGAAIERGFVLKDFLSKTSDEALLSTPLQVMSDIRIERQYRSEGTGWINEKIVLRKTKGIHYTGNLDGHMMGLIGRCNGKRPLSELINELAEHLGVEKFQITDSVLQIIRGLIERGFVLPIDLIGT